MWIFSQRMARWCPCCKGLSHSKAPPWPTSSTYLKPSATTVSGSHTRWEWIACQLEIPFQRVCTFSKTESETKILPKWHNSKTNSLVSGEISNYWASRGFTFRVISGYVFLFPGFARGVFHLLFMGEVRSRFGGSEPRLGGARGSDFLAACRW